MRDVEDPLQRLRALIIRVVTVIVVTSISSGTAESFMGLRAWAVEHNMDVIASYLFPFIIDAFPLGAEFVLILGYIDHWKNKPKIALWAVLTLGLAVSVALNVGAVRSTDYLTLATHGAFPVATWLALVVGTVMFKRVINNKPKADEDERDEDDDELEDGPSRWEPPDFERASRVFADAIDQGRVPGLGLIKRSLKPCGRNKAEVYQAHLRYLVAQSTS